MSSHDNRSSASRRAGHGSTPLTEEWHRTRGEVASGSSDADFSVVRDGSGAVYRRSTTNPSTAPYPPPRSDASRMDASADLRRRAMSGSMAAGSMMPPPPICPPMYYKGQLPAGYVGPAPPGISTLPKDITIMPRGYVDPTPTPDCQGMEMLSVRDANPEATQYLTNKDMFQPSVDYAGNAYQHCVNVTNNYRNNNSINYFFPKDPNEKTPEEFGRDKVKEAREKAEKTMEGYAKYFANAEFDRRLEAEKRAAEDAQRSAMLNDSSSSVRRPEGRRDSHFSATGTHDADATRFAKDTTYQSQYTPYRPDGSHAVAHMAPTYVDRGTSASQAGHGTPRMAPSQAPYGTPRMAASQPAYGTPRMAPSQAGYGTPSMAASQASYRQASSVPALPAPSLAGSYMNSRAGSRANPQLVYRGDSPIHFSKPVGPGSSSSQVPSTRDSKVRPYRPFRSGEVTEAESQQMLMEWREDVASMTGSYRGNPTPRNCNNSRRG